MISFPRLFSLKGSEKKIVKVIDRLEITRSENLSFVDAAAVKVASVPLRLRAYRTLDDYVEHLSEKMAAAVQGGAQLVVFPELAGLVPLTMVPKYSGILADYKAAPSSERPQLVSDVLYDYFDFIQEVYFTTFSELACQYGVYLLAGSLYYCEGEVMTNRAYLFDPDGDVVGYQDKTHLTEWEAALGVTPGSELALLETRLGRVAVAIGQDSCYFEVYRIARGLGAQVMLCPTCNLNYGSRNANLTDAYLRVQETPMFAVKAAMTGDILHQRYGGVCGIYCPASLAEEKQGILATSESSPERPLVCRINLEKLSHVDNPRLNDDNPSFLQQFRARHYGAPSWAEAASKAEAAPRAQAAPGVEAAPQTEPVSQTGAVPRAEAVPQADAFLDPEADLGTEFF